MQRHDLWHIVVLGTTLFAGAAAAIVALAPVIFERPPQGLDRVRPAAIGLGVVAVVLLAVEWLGIH